MKIKKYLYIGIGLVFIILSALTGILFVKNSNLESKLSVAVQNEKAALNSNLKTNNDNIAYKLKVNQLNYYNDSLLTELNNVRKGMKIKDNQIKSLQYITTQAKKKDTIVFNDTIFQEAVFNLDTIIGDNWYSLKLRMSYPNTIVSEPVFNSEIYIMTYSKKETINPPKKFFLFRWFQKKQQVVHVSVVDNNPYVNIEQNRFIEIIK